MRKCLNCKETGPKKCLSFGRQVIHLYDYDIKGNELNKLGITGLVQAFDSNDLQYADEAMFLYRL